VVVTGGGRHSHAHGGGSCSRCTDCRRCVRHVPRGRIEVRVGHGCNTGKCR
jgi:hypothetical protein